MNAMLVHAQVVSADADRGCVYVMLPSGAIPSAFPARMLHQGHADAVRIKQSPLPTKGTDGLVAILYGDTRNAIWMGSMITSGRDARTHPDDPDAEYTADHGGGYSLLNGDGQYTRMFPDGTTVSVTADGNPLVATRHTVDDTQTRQSVAYSATDRRPATPTPHHVVVKTASGVTITVPPAGSVTVDLPGGETFDLTQGGASASDALVLVSKFVSAFNAHVHISEPPGAKTSAPVKQLQPSDVFSVIAKTSG